MKNLPENDYQDSREIEITYIKDGKETTKKIPEYAAWTSNIIYSAKNNSIAVEEDIELLHIKNLHCKKGVYITCANKDTIIILENCSFTRDATFRSGHISIVNPQFIDEIVYGGNGPRYQGTELIIWEAEEVELCLEKRNAEDKNKNEIAVKNVKKLTIRGDASNIDITSSTIDIKSNTVLDSIPLIHLNKAANFTFNKLEASHIIIENSDEIEFNEDYYYDYNQLEIINSTVKISCNKLGKESFKYGITGSTTHIKNSVLELAKDAVTISGNVYYTKGGNKKIIFLDDKFNQNGNKVVAATNLISDLKAISKLVTSKGDKGLNKIYSEYRKKQENVRNTIRKYYEQIEYYKRLINSYQETMEELANEERIKCDEYIEQIHAEPVKSFVKK